MTMKLTGYAALSVVLAATPALAQTPAPAAAPATVHGPAIPGLCVLSQQDAISNSAVGKAVRQRVLQLEAQIRADVTSQKDALDKDIQAFQTTRATLSAEAVTQRGTELQDRANRFEQNVQTKAAQLEATQNKALGRISQEIQPVVNQAYQAHTCSILIDDAAILAGTPSMDLTPDVIRGLDARIKDFQIDLEPAPLAAPASAPAAAPAARTPAAAAPRR